VESLAKEAKVRSMNEKIRSSFEAGLQNIAGSLSKKEVLSRRIECISAS
jgi:hypothetical protein